MVYEVLISRVKVVDNVLDDEIWTSVVGFRLGGEKVTIGFKEFNKLVIF